MVKRRSDNNNNNNNKKEKQKKKKADVDESEKNAEDYCFVCKDGGLLIVCDHQDCVKAYHPECVGKEESDADAGESWICGWHTCLVCGRRPKIHCFCCPNAVCSRCIKESAFAQVRATRGFCQDCLKLALLGEEGLDFDSDGEKVDFKDRETYECLFKEYWDIIKEEENLTLEDLHNADVQIKKSGKTPPPTSNSDSEEYFAEEENSEPSSDDNDHISPSKRKPSKGSLRKRKGPHKIEFVGWASRNVIQFLASIGIDTRNKLSQDDVTSIITKYVHENNLLDPKKRRKVLCDARLQSVLGRKSVSIYKIDDILDDHFLENLEQSDDEEQGHSSAHEEEDILSSQDKQEKRSSVANFQRKDPVVETYYKKELASEDHKKEARSVTVSYSCFASIIPMNLKLVYLRRSLVEELMKELESFESKMVGSFVKIKSDSIDNKLFHQLLPVTGIKKTSADGEKTKVALQVPVMPYDVTIRMLSNDDLSEEECKDLRTNIEKGLIARPTVVELEKKAKALHEDITKHWIDRELALLRNRIDMANEKGWRMELFEYLQKRQLLRSKEEQMRLLQEVPRVIADILEIEPTDAEETHQSDGSDPDAI